MAMRSTMVKPVYSTPPHPLAGEMVPLTLFDRATYDIFIPVMLVYPAPTPSNEALKEGLGRSIALYPHLAGRLAVDQRGRRCLHINDEGVLVLEAAVPARMSTVLANTEGLYPPPTLPEDNNRVAVMQIKLNRYRCGGLAIGFCSHHQVADGHSISNFLTTWASAVRQGMDFAAPSPFLDRASTSVPRTVPTPVFDHGSIEFKAGEDRAAPAPLSLCKFKSITLRYTYSAEFVAELKARVGGPCSTFQCLLAHLWKRTTEARGLAPDEFTVVRVAVNCRGRADPPVPLDLVGNMVLWAFPRLQARDVLRWSYGGVVGAIRDAVARIDGEYIQSFVDFGAAHRDSDRGELTATAGTMCYPNLEVDSWLGFKFHKIDLGSGPPAAFLMPDLPVEGLMVFVPSCATTGDVDVCISLREDHVRAFHNISHSFDHPTYISSSM